MTEEASVRVNAASMNAPNSRVVSLLSVNLSEELKNRYR
jgi:hypothetical protein